MNAEEYFRKGSLYDALKVLQEQVRIQPENIQYRTFLFQLFVVLGQWPRALNQLGVLDKLDKDSWPLVHIYRDAIQCELLRSEIFAGRKKPLIFGDPPHWMAWLLESLRLAAEAQYDQAVSLRDEAFDSAVGSSGLIDEKPFEWIADADSRLGPVLEMILNGRYYWVPFQQIRAIRMKQPENVHDFVWMPAQFTWVNGGQAFGLIPTRYPGSETVDDSAIQLARETEWKELADNVYQGFGQRWIATDQDNYRLLDIRNVKIH